MLFHVVPLDHHGKGVYYLFLDKLGEVYQPDVTREYRWSFTAASIFAATNLSDNVTGEDNVWAGMKVHSVKCYAPPAVSQDPLTLSMLLPNLHLLFLLSIDTEIHDLESQIGVRASPNKIAMAKYHWNVTDQNYIFPTTGVTQIMYMDISNQLQASIIDQNITDLFQCHVEITLVGVGSISQISYTPCIKKEVSEQYQELTALACELDITIIPGLPTIIPRNRGKVIPT